jgi:hypothetical protein
MERLILRSTSSEALRAELHRSELLKEAVSHRQARGAGPDVATLVPGRHGTIIGRFRAALAGAAIDRGRQSAEC